MINLSADADNGIRLLDEGAVVNADGGVWFYIEKGALERFLSSLDDDFEGYIKYGHTDFANDPILLGSYKKSDFTLVDMGDGRQSLYVKPTWFDTYRLRDIKAMPFDVGVSVEMNCVPDTEASKEMGFPVYEDLFISGFAVVGEAGNVNSSGVRLGGKAMDLKTITQALEEQTTFDLAAIQEALDKSEDKAETIEANVEETVEETAEETVDEATDVVDETEEAADETEEVATDEVLAKVEELTSKIEELEKENEELKMQVETLTNDKAELSEKLSVKEAEEKDFIEKFKGLTLSMSDPVKPEVTGSSFAMDGIGE